MRVWLMADYSTLKGYRYIAVNKGIHGTAEPLIIGSRIRVSEVLQMVIEFKSIKEVCENYGLPEAAVIEALTFAKDELDKAYENDTGR
jgi:uncharacterized protein (DUF433 family)